MRTSTVRWTLSLAAGLAASLVFAQTPDVDGEVRKIDKAQQKITLKHGEIRNIQMPPMTMAFRVQDAKALDTLEVGDKVRFSAEKVDGQFTITAIQKAR